MPAAVARVRLARVPYQEPPTVVKKPTVRQFALTRLIGGKARFGQAGKPLSNLWYVLRGLFDKGWWALGPAMMGVSVRQCRRYYRGEYEPTLQQLRRLEKWARRMPALLEEWRVEAHAVVDAEAERRGLEIAGAVTRLRAMVIAREAADKAKEAARAARLVQKKAAAEARRSRAGGRGDADPLRLREGRHVLGTRARGRPKKGVE